jgi:dTDP-4-amino-4,6-dideoxygalactose transaminase
MKIPFNRPYLTGGELRAIRRALAGRHLSGNGPFTRACQGWLEDRLGCKKALLTHSGTAALEMAAILADLRPGDEVIMPSFTFVSTANAFVLRGAVPVFVDVRPDTFNLDETRIETAITSRTRAIVAVHYGGVGCEMDPIMELAGRHELLVIEDAAQGFGATYRGRALGSIGHLAALSFHETKNVVSGEGGALLINDDRFVERAEVIWEKGTNRSRYFRGEVDKYTWIDIGSSFLPGELIAAFLWPQLRHSRAITRGRQAVWDLYHEGLARAEAEGWARRPIIPESCGHNSHLYYLLVRDLQTRSELIASLKRGGISAVFHYVPLHNSPAGLKYGRAVGDMAATLEAGDRIVRLPLWVGGEKAAARVVAEVEAFYRRRARRQVA